MTSRSKRAQSFALALELPAHVVARSGYGFDPRADQWSWLDGVFVGWADYDRMPRAWKHYIYPLKIALIPFVKGYSSRYVMNLFEAFLHMASILKSVPENGITPGNISNYGARLGPLKVGRIGTLSCLVQMWVRLGLPGVNPECGSYFSETSKPSYAKGRAVVTRDPITGPFTESEFKALHAATADGLERGTLPLWVLVLTKLLSATGGRISQPASSKISDWDESPRVLRLPQAKTGFEHTRVSFLEFDLSSRNAALMSLHIANLRNLGYVDTSPLFPQNVVLTPGVAKIQRPESDLFHGHCDPQQLSSAYCALIREVAPLTTRLDLAPIPISPKRFRYTFGTRMVEEGASKIVVANRLGHVDLQNVGCYFDASPKIVENIDRALTPLIAPLAQAFLFKGRLVSGPDGSTHNGTTGSRIIDFRVSSKTLGGCEGNCKNCMLLKPDACYTCFRFEPWLDGPHVKVLHRLKSEQENYSEDARIAEIKDDTIQAVEEVIALCKLAESNRPGSTRGAL